MDVLVVWVSTETCLALNRPEPISCWAAVAGGSGKAAVEQPVHEHPPPGSAVLWESTAYLTSSVSQLSAPLWERQDGDQHGRKSN